MRTEPVPDNAMAMLLHRRTEPSDEHLDTLIEALRVVQSGLKEQPFLSRDLTAALWILGVEANTITSEVSEAEDEIPHVAFRGILSSHAKESRYFVPTCARISATLWQSVSKFW